MGRRKQVAPQRTRRRRTGGEEEDSNAPGGGGMAARAGASGEEVGAAKSAEAEAAKSQGNKGPMLAASTQLRGGGGDDDDDAAAKPAAAEDGIDIWEQLQGFVQASIARRNLFVQAGGRPAAQGGPERERIRANLRARLQRRDESQADGSASSSLTSLSSAGISAEETAAGEPEAAGGRPCAEARERQEVAPNGEFACVAKQGKRDYMEDCFSTQLSAGKANVHLFGVYDGHGGSLCAEFCAEELLGTLARHAQLESDPPRAMQAAFECLDSVFCELSHENSLQDGSTATVAIARPLADSCVNLTVGNVGDSRCVLVRKGQQVEVLTRDHVPSLDDEAERIRDQGGMVIMCGGLARVQGCLAVSRALGDASLKPFVTGTPEVISRQVRTDEGAAFLCIASDGVWDEVTSAEAAEILLSEGAEPGAGHLVRLALDRGSDDNLTCMVVDLCALRRSDVDGSADTTGTGAPEEPSKSEQKKRTAPSRDEDPSDSGDVANETQSRRLTGKDDAPPREREAHASASSRSTRRKLT